MAEASSIMAALITSQNSPSVSRTSGKVMIVRKTPSVALTKPITRAAINADSHPLTWKPGTRWETIQTASALNTQFTRCLIEVPGKRDYRLSLRLAQPMAPRTSKPPKRNPATASFHSATKFPNVREKEDGHLRQKGTRNARGSLCPPPPLWHGLLHLSFRAAVSAASPAPGNAPHSRGQEFPQHPRSTQVSEGHIDRQEMAPSFSSRSLASVTLGNFHSLSGGSHMPEATLSGADFKKQLRAESPKMGLFLNAHSPTLAEQLAHSGYDWLLVDTQHGPMGYEKLSAMLSGIANGGAKSLVRVGGYDDRPRIH